MMAMEQGPANHERPSRSSLELTLPEPLPEAPIDFGKDDDPRGLVVIIGAQKAGTTSLFDILGDRAEIATSFRKETNVLVEGTVQEYKRAFRPGGSWRLEASPVYTMRHERRCPAARLAAFRPDARLVFIYRDPIARAISQHRHDVISARTPATIDPQVLAPHAARFARTSMYAWQLSPWLREFPDEQFLFLDFDELARNPQAIDDKVSYFLGLDLRKLTARADRARNTAAGRSVMPVFLIRHSNSLWFRTANRLLPQLIQRVAKGLIAFLTPKRTAPALDARLLSAMSTPILADKQSFERLRTAAPES